MLLPAPVERYVYREVIEMSNQTRDAEYTMGRSAEETERLIEQSQLYDDVTRRFFLRSGIAKGMKVLDVGSGAGDVALTVAEFVGPEGKVVGVDVNPDVLKTAQERGRCSRLYKR